MEMLAVCSRVLYDNDILNKMKEVDDLKKEFKEKGEETASKIEVLVSKEKVMVHKIVD